jgi:hypothetical protein
MFKYKEFFLALTEVQSATALSMIDAVSKFTGTETNTYVKGAKTFVESSKENAQKAIKGEFLFSGSKD